MSCFFANTIYSFFEFIEKLVEVGGILFFRNELQQTQFDFSQGGVELGIDLCSWALGGARDSFQLLDFLGGGCELALQGSQLSLQFFVLLVQCFVLLGQLDFDGI